MYKTWKRENVKRGNEGALCHNLVVTYNQQNYIISVK